MNYFRYKDYDGRKILDKEDESMEESSSSKEDEDEWTQEECVNDEPMEAKKVAPRQAKARFTRSSTRLTSFEKEDIPEESK